jgi:RNA polymerase sigma-70 factor (ECF subfamily)
MTASLLRFPTMSDGQARPRLEIVADEPHSAREAAVRDREAQAIARLAAGDVDALGDLYDLHHAAVRSFARRYLGDTHAAEDVVHDVFLALPDAAAKLRQSGSLRSYLLGIAVNLARHHLRAARRRRDAMSRFGALPETRPETPDQEIAREQLAGALHRALDELSHDHRATFVLCEIEERPGPEVASILGIPEATVRTRLFHAKRKLRELLEAVR